MNPSSASNDVHVRLSGVRMSFRDREVFRDLSCHFPRGKISVLLGASGSGKTTILRLVGGLVCARSGSIVVDGEEIAHLSERRMFRVRKKLGMLFQSGALLDSMTVFDNLALPLREHGSYGPPEIAAEVRDRLEAVGLSGVDHLLPRQLSGGMVKRVGLARAIIGRPQILLCDEPFSGLDPVSMRRIEDLLVSINHRYGMTTIVVSHDVPSTLRMADWALLLLPEGAVEGTPEALLRSGKPHVVDFLSQDAGRSPAFREAAGKPQPAWQQLSHGMH